MNSFGGDAVVSVIQLYSMHASHCVRKRNEALSILSSTS
jgi:hypothetical protein